MNAVKEPLPNAISGLPESDEMGFAGRRFREVLGQLPTGVTMVTAQTPSGPAGMTANSFGSVSLEPPLVLFWPAKASETWPKLRSARHLRFRPL